MRQYLLPAFALCVNSVLAVVEYGDQIPGALSGKPFTNISTHGIEELNLRDLLLGRQSTCYSPNIYCPVGGYCCYPGENCCAGGCAPSDATTCCGASGYCPTGYGCCEQTSCTPLDAECCSNGGYCPDPFMCVEVLATGQLGCCTDLSCTVYLSNSQTVTYTPSTQATATATRVAAMTTKYTSYDYTETDYYYSYRTWTTWYYMYYYYYYYTVYYSPSTFTTREVTTIDRTTTLTFAGTDSYDASSYFSSCSRTYTTPSDANNFLPLTPTAGALVVGSCSFTSTMDDGFVTSECATTTAGSSTSSARSGSSSTGSSSFSGGGTSGSSSVVRREVPWLPITLMTLGMAVGALMIAL